MSVSAAFALFFLNILFWLAVQDEEGRLVISKIRDRLYLITGLEMIYRTYGQNVLGKRIFLKNGELFDPSKISICGRGV